MDRLETRDLVYFVAVAEELHFGRAAQRLGIAQPVLSRSVARLERRLGVRLLERTSRRAELTTAGTVLLDEGRRLLASLDGAVHRTRRAAHPGPLTLAVRPGSGTGLLARLLRAYPGEPPQLLFTYDRAEALRSGFADAALFCLGTDDLTGLRTVEVATEDPVALLPSGHPLAGQPHVTIAQLHADPAFAQTCPPLGLDELVDRVALERLVVVVGSGVVDRLGPDLASVPVSDLPPTTLALGWPRRGSQPEVADLARTARQLRLEPSTSPARKAMQNADPRPSPRSAARSANSARLLGRHR